MAQQQLRERRNYFGSVGCKSCFNLSTGHNIALTLGEMRSESVSSLLTRALPLSLVSVSRFCSVLAECVKLKPPNPPREKSAL